MNIAVIGAGYVGLVTAACFADLGNRVINIDRDKKKIDLLKKGKSHFYEPGLEELLKTHLKNGRLKFTTIIESAIANSDVVFIAVGTPPREDGGADLSQIEDVARRVAKTLKKTHKLIIEKSTVPVRTGKNIQETIRRYAKKGALFDVASNPEFLREGTAIHDFMNPDRIVLGADTQRAKNILRKLYQNIKAPLVLTDLESAEMIKHASNSFLSMKISFINAVSRICELSGANIEDVARGMGLDGRIGGKFLNAGIGFGGFCFPKDLAAFIHISGQLGYDFQLLKSVERINADQVRHFIQKIEKELWNVRGKKIGILGLSFKPNTDDMRYAPSIEIINYLKTSGAEIKVYDPKAMKKAKEVLPTVKYAKDAYEVCRSSDCLLILTEWNEFKEIDLKKVKTLLKTPLIIDGRNIYDTEIMKQNGIKYISMGR